MVGWGSMRPARGAGTVKKKARPERPDRALL